MEPITIVSEVLFSLARAYFTASQKAGLPPEQAKQNFLNNYDQFMAESDAPVDEVDES